MWIATSSCCLCQKTGLLLTCKISANIALSNCVTSGTKFLMLCHSSKVYIGCLCGTDPYSRVAQFLIRSTSLTLPVNVHMTPDVAKLDSMFFNVPLCSSLVIDYLIMGIQYGIMPTPAKTALLQNIVKSYHLKAFPNPYCSPTDQCLCGGNLAISAWKTVCVSAI